MRQRKSLLNTRNPQSTTGGLRLWMTRAHLEGDELEIGRVEIFFDGERHPRVDLPANELFSGKVAPFLAPLCGGGVLEGGGSGAAGEGARHLFDRPDEDVPGADAQVLAEAAVPDHSHRRPG